MSSVDPAALIILSEIVLIETSILLFVFIFSIFRKRKKSKALTKLMNDAGSAADQRKSELKNAFRESGLSDEEKNAAVADIVEKELTLYRNLSAAIHSGKISLTHELPAVISEMAKPYQNLAKPGAAIGGQDAGQNSYNNKSAEAVIDELLEEESNGDDSIVDPSLDLSNTSDVEEIPEDLLKDEEEEETSA